MTEQEMPEVLNEGSSKRVLFHGFAGTYEWMFDREEPMETIYTDIFADLMLHFAADWYKRGDDDIDTLDGALEFVLERARQHFEYECPFDRNAKKGTQ